MNKKNELIKVRSILEKILVKYDDREKYEEMEDKRYFVKLVFQVQNEIQRLESIEDKDNEIAKLIKQKVELEKTYALEE